MATGRDLERSLIVGDSLTGSNIEEGRKPTVSQLSSDWSVESDRSTLNVWFFGQKDTPQGVVFCVGLGIFILGYICHLWGDHLPQYDYDEVIMYMFYGLCQTAGLVIMTLADLDVNTYLARKPHRVLAFVALLVAYTTTLATTDPQPVSEVYWIQMLPLAYLMLRFDAVRTMSANLKFTEVFVAFLILSVVSSFCFEALEIPHADLRPTWPFYMSVCWGVVCVVTITLAYKLAIARGDSLTLAMNYAVYVYLLMLGIDFVMDINIHTKVYGHSYSFSKRCFGWMHVIPAALMLIFRSTIQSRLGQHWLRQRLKAQGVAAEFTLEEALLGKLPGVEQALECGGDMNRYYPRVEGGLDRFTLLLYSSGNGHSDAVEVLVALDSVAVNFASKHKGYSPIYMASRNGHAAALKLLIAAGGNVNQADARGFSPLYVAVLMGHIDIVRLLINAGAWQLGVNQEILLVAEAKGHSDIVDLLVMEGAAKNTDKWMGLKAKSAKKIDEDERILRESVRRESVSSAGTATSTESIFLRISDKATKISKTVSKASIKASRNSKKIFRKLKASRDGEVQDDDGDVELHEWQGSDEVLPASMLYDTVLRSTEGISLGRGVTFDQDRTELPPAD
jgi:hypothetical protein